MKAAYWEFLGCGMISITYTVNLGFLSHGSNKSNTTSFSFAMEDLLRPEQTNAACCTLEM